VSGADPVAVRLPGGIEVSLIADYFNDAAPRIAQPQPQSQQPSQPPRAAADTRPVAPWRTAAAPAPAAAASVASEVPRERRVEEPDAKARELAVRLLTGPPHRRSEEELIELQQGRCASCSKPLQATGVFGSRGRFCHYTERLHCTGCHVKDERVIPAYVIHKLDTKKYPVCVLARIFLDNVYEVPQILVAHENPNIFRQSSKLSHAQALRVQLSHIRAFVKTCREEARLMQILRGYEHMMAPQDDPLGSDRYSLRDLVEILSGNLVERIADWTDRLARHIADGGCAICASKGHLCEYCQDARPIYAFQVLDTARCPVCKGIFHRKCFQPDNCPRCKRKARRRANSSDKAPA
jgi:hypothetical protein